MTHEPESVSITATVPDDEEPALKTLLTEYHTWLAAKAREWASGRESAAETDATDPLPVDGEYDPAGAAAEDVATVADPGASAQGFLAFGEGAAAGVVLLYGVSEGMTEIKRLYVRPAYRESGLGRALCRTAIDAAREGGYGTVGLTTPPWSEGAHALYEALGFSYTEPYPETKLPEHLHEEALFMQRDIVQ